MLAEATVVHGYKPVCGQPAVFQDIFVTVVPQAAPGASPGPYSCLLGNSSGSPGEAITLDFTLDNQGQWHPASIRPDPRGGAGTSPDPNVHPINLWNGGRDHCLHTAFAESVFPFQ